MMPPGDPDPAPVEDRHAPWSAGEEKRPANSLSSNMLMPSRRPIGQRVASQPPIKLAGNLLKSQDHGHDREMKVFPSLKPWSSEHRLCW